MKIAYRENGVTTILFPSGALPDEETARKDVPYGCPYIFVKDKDVPDRFEDYQNMKLDFDNPDGYGSDYGVGSDNIVIAYDDEYKPTIVKQKELKVGFNS